MKTNNKNTSQQGLVTVHGGNPTITIAYAHEGPATATSDTDARQQAPTATARRSLADNTGVVIILLIAALIGTVAAVIGIL